MAEPDFSEHRQQIDEIDRQIHTLLNQRAECARRIAEAKLADKPDSEKNAVAFYRPEREAQVLGAVIDRNKNLQGHLPDSTVAHIFREIMSACLALEQPTEVAFLGPEGTFTQEAAIKHFGNAAVPSPQSSIADVFRAVQSGDVRYGVVPVENSTEGVVNHTLDSFIESPRLRICGEVQLRIRQQLLMSKSGHLDNIKAICGHQQSLAQTHNWLAKHWPKTLQQAVVSNAEAARMAAADATLLAVAGEMAAELYDLEIVAPNIEDRHDNTTRFLVLGTDEIPPSGSDKTSLMVATRDKPGALFHLLEPFQRANVMLTRIDTRPSRTDTWAYMFFIEFEGHRDDPHIQPILAEVESMSFVTKVLGSYPRAVF